MSQIQADMFEVQLGASILLQMQDTIGASVRVLADGGISPKGRYTTSHVNVKLVAAFQDFDKSLPSACQPPTSNARYRIDLMVGTHYDEDHLRGLIDVAKNGQIDITEAWLPPIQQSCLSKNSITSATDDESSILELEEFDLADYGELQKYLDSQTTLCQVCSWHLRRLNELHDASDLSSEPEPPMPWFSERNAEIIDTWRGEEDEVEPESDSSLPEVLARRMEELRRFLIEADAHLPNGLKGNHENSIGEARRTGLNMSYGWQFSWPYHARRRYFLRPPGSYHPLAVQADIQQLAYVQKCGAKSGIIAIWLNQLVTELKKRSPYVIISSQSIRQGSPEYFVWDRSSMRFLHNSAAYATNTEPKLTLLGPSHELITKYQTLLPIGSYMMLLGFVAVKRITPSNQLSYTLLFESSAQQVLLTGDAGCVDFLDKTAKGYFQTMLDALGEPNIVQVAHHAGSNADFYKVLLQSKYATSSQESYLLLSHATHDRHRPSTEFKSFLDTLTKTSPATRKLHLLFTSEPLPTNPTVTFHQGLFHPVVGSPALEGDVRLVYSNGAWRVIKHAIP